MTVAERAEAIAAVVAKLPDGQRHKGFYWAAMTAAENHIPTAKIAEAAVGNGLDAGYVQRTLKEAREAVQRE